jgi:hypothetical protein
MRMIKTLFFPFLLSIRTFWCGQDIAVTRADSNTSRGPLRSVTVTVKGTGAANNCTREELLAFSMISNAWKNGKLNFAHERIDVIMRKISPVFDINATDQSEITVKGFVSTLVSSAALTEILKTSELTGRVPLKVNGRSVTVMP